jgi:hypothetical protein
MINIFSSLTDVTHPFFKINELQFSEFATTIDSSERLRNISSLKHATIRGSMKLFSITLILIAVLGLMAYINPKLDNYDQFISQRITEETRKEKDPMAGALSSLLGGFAANIMTRQTVRKDYVFFSTYDTDFGNEHIRAIGVLNNFYITESPESKRGE